MLLRTPWTATMWAFRGGFSGCFIGLLRPFLHSNVLGCPGHSVLIQLLQINSNVLECPRTSSPLLISATVACGCPAHCLCTMLVTA
jgi:hypothetical protein